MSIFKTKGFDTVIAKDVVISGTMTIAGTCVIDGTFNGDSIKSEKSADDKTKSVLVVNGKVVVKEVVMSDDLTITGSVTACAVRVEGILAIKSGCVLRASTISYRTLVAEPGAIIIGELRHLDHSSNPLEV
jgi:cytoskeletal protein CcmA (bactofilin family)